MDQPIATPSLNPRHVGSGRQSTKRGTGDSFFVGAPAVDLPKGGGAIRSMGEKFAANPVTGTGSLTVPIATSPGRGGFGPRLSLSYNSGAGNNPFGFPKRGISLGRTVSGHMPFQTIGVGDRRSVGSSRAPLPLQAAGSCCAVHLGKGYAPSRPTARGGTDGTPRR
jgi:hypothetical protein